MSSVSSTMNQVGQDKVPMPRSIYFIFVLQIFSTMSFAVLYSTLVLFMHEKLGFSDHKADLITGVFFAYNFGLHLLAGIIGGRLLSYRLVIAISLVAQLIGCLFLSQLTPTAFYIGLAVILTGAGNMVTCINMLVSENFSKGDERREKAFFWMYSGMNVGFFLGFSLAGHFQLTDNYAMLFTLTSISNVISLLVVFMAWRLFKDKYSVLAELPKSSVVKRNALGFLIIACLPFILFFLLQHAEISGWVVMAAGICMVALILYWVFSWDREKSRKLLCFLVLLVSAQVFWLVYQMAPMGLTLFARYNVDLQLWGMKIPPAWLQNINTTIIIIFGPILAAVFDKVRHRWHIEILPPQKFICGMFLSSMGLFTLVFGIDHANALGMVALVWLFLYYVFQAFAELFISPMSYSMVGRLVPERFQSIMMGTVLLNTGVAAVLASKVSNHALGLKDNAKPLLTDGSFLHVFRDLGFTTLAVGVVLLILFPLLKKLMK